MKAILLYIVFFLITFSINAQNGVYSCKRQEYRPINPTEKKITYNNCKVSIQIFGVGGDDFVTADVLSENPEECKTYKWKINEELYMSPAAKGKKIFRTYRAIFKEGGNVKDEFVQFSIIKGKKKGRITITSINEDGIGYWFYDLEKFQKK